MLRDLLSDWAGGKLPPRRFAVLYGLFIAGLIGFFGGAAILAMVTIGHGNASSHTVGSFAMILIVGLFLLFAGLFNIVVKRGRDIGIPGYVTGIVFIFVFFMGGLGVFLSILLALVPSDTIATART